HGWGETQPIGITRSLRARRDLPERHQFLCLRIRQRLEQDAVEDAENRGVCSNAERERSNDDERETWAPAENPQGMAEITSNLIEQRAMTMRPNPFLGLLRPSDFQNSHPPRFISWNPSAYFFGRTQVDKRLDFLV